MTQAQFNAVRRDTAQLLKATLRRATRRNKPKTATGPTSETSSTIRRRGHLVIVRGPLLGGAAYRRGDVGQLGSSHRTAMTGTGHARDGLFHERSA